MTTVAMTAGMVPTALSLSGDGAWRAPMGTVVIGGLILSTLLTLLIVPAGFSLADGLEKRLGPWLRDRVLTYEPGDEAQDARRRLCRRSDALDRSHDRRAADLVRGPNRPAPPARPRPEHAPRRHRAAGGDGRAVRARRSAMLDTHPAWGYVLRLLRSGDGRRAGRLVRGDRAVPPSARPADPAHRDHPGEQGPHRRYDGGLPARPISSPRRWSPGACGR